jgi:hypothetical protein
MRTRSKPLVDVIALLLDGLDELAAEGGEGKRLRCDLEATNRRGFGTLSRFHHSSIFVVSSQAVKHTEHRVACVHIALHRIAFHRTA